MFTIGLNTIVMWEKRNEKLAIKYEIVIFSFQLLYGVRYKSNNRMHWLQRWNFCLGNYILKGGTKCRNENVLELKDKLEMKQERESLRRRKICERKNLSSLSSLCLNCNVSTKEHNRLKLQTKSDLDFFIVLKLFFVQKIKCQT